MIAPLIIELDLTSNDEVADSGAAVADILMDDLLEYVKKIIKNGRVKEMTIRELAEIAGVSPATISIVLNNKTGVSDETRARVQAILHEHNYAPQKVTKKSLHKRIILVKYRTHGLAVEENQGFIASIIDHIESECRYYSYELSMYNCNEDTISESISKIREGNADGVIFLGTEFLSKNSNDLKALKKPLVVLDNSMYNCNVDSVVMENETIMINAVDYLYEMGYRDIGYARSKIGIDNLRERYDGYLGAMKEHDLIIQKPIWVTPTLIGAYTDTKKMLETNMLKLNRVIIADNDSIAIGMLRAIQEHGIKIPEEVSIMGVDDVPYSSMTMPSLTTMRVSRSTLGALAVDILKKRMQHPKWPPIQVRISGQLIERDSVIPIE